jgi:hypothetical protein
MSPKIVQTVTTPFGTNYLARGNRFPRSKADLNLVFQFDFVAWPQLLEDPERLQVLLVHD